MTRHLSIFYKAAGLLNVSSIMGFRQEIGAFAFSARNWGIRTKGGWEAALERKAQLEAQTLLHTLVNKVVKLSLNKLKGSW